MSPPSPGSAPRAFESGAESGGVKAALRASVLAARAVDRRRAEADAARLPWLLEVSAGHSVVACYASVAPEPDTWALIEALAGGGVRVLLPVLTGRRTPGWGWYAGRGSLVPGWRGILQPGEDLGPDAVASASLVWASALLVTPRGLRLGTGGGWYDRALVHRRPDAVVATLVGDSEVVDALPEDPWDVPVDVIVTPRRVLRVGAEQAGRPPR